MHCRCVGEGWGSRGANKILNFITHRFIHTESAWNWNRIVFFLCFAVPTNSLLFFHPFAYRSTGWGWENSGLFPVGAGSGSVVTFLPFFNKRSWNIYELDGAYRPLFHRYRGRIDFNFDKMWYKHHLMRFVCVCVPIPPREIECVRGYKLLIARAWIVQSRKK